MSREMVPFSFSFSTEVIPVASTQFIGDGQFQAVHFTVSQDEQLSWYVERLEAWFADRDEVILVASGSTLHNEGFIVLEWEEHEIDPLFLKILEHEEGVTDVSVYTRSEEVE